MRRITYWALSTVSALVLLFSYHTSTSGATTATPPSSVVSGTTPGSSTKSSSATTSSSGSGGSSTTGSSGSSSGTTSKTVTGDVAQTQWGPVQVQITVKGGSITKVTVPTYPSGNPRDTEINDYALPILIQETTKAQSAQIDMVSGATYTSDGYVQSLQAALDQAGVA